MGDLAKLPGVDQLGQRTGRAYRTGYQDGYAQGRRHRPAIAWTRGRLFSIDVKALLPLAALAIAVIWALVR